MDQAFLNVWERASRIEGWLAEVEAELLFNLCESPWCEIGSWKGRSTTVLASKGFGYAVDWFKGSTEHHQVAGGLVDVRRDFDKNTIGLDIEVIAKTYEDAVDDVPDVKFLFLDAEHTYLDTKRVFNLYSPKTDLVVIHDAYTDWQGVTAFVGELRAGKEWEYTDQVLSCAVFRRA